MFQILTKFQKLKRWTSLILMMMKMLPWYMPLNLKLQSRNYVEVLMSWMLIEHFFHHLKVKLGLQRSPIDFYILLLCVFIHGYQSLRCVVLQILTPELILNFNKHFKLTPYVNFTPLELSYLFPETYNCLYDIFLRWFLIRSPDIFTGHVTVLDF